MKTKLNFLRPCLLLLASTASALAAVRYVDGNSTSPTPPYTNWSTAAVTIQDAVDAAAPGDEIVVTDGIYSAGGRAIGTSMLTNRVAVDKPIALRSVNGPQFTIIQGAKASGGGDGEGAIRCVYLASGASLSGFTLTDGATRTDGDRDREQIGGGVWCASSNATLTNCVLTGNSAEWQGGGALGGTLRGCTLAGNWAWYGGGASGGALRDCTLTDNSALYGGGASECTLSNCELTGNQAGIEGGGAGCEWTPCTLYNCTLTGNSSVFGGGAAGGTLYGCVLTDNSATGNGVGGCGGGACGCTLYNCTLTGNWAEIEGGGAWQGTNYNCILYFNRARYGANYGTNYSFSTFAYSCTSPLPPGPGNIDADPQLATTSHLSFTSPCIGAGNPADARGVDIDGEPWANPPAMGADQPGPASGLLSLWIEAGCTNAVPGYPVSFTAWNTGAILKTEWDFGDGMVLANQPFATHAWSALGVYTVRLIGYNESCPGGVVATVVVTVSKAKSYYVDAASLNPVFPYGSWETAAATIQEAIEAGTQAGRVVLVTNGVYQIGTVGGANEWNRVALTGGVVVRSMNGPEVTMIEGAQPDQETGEGLWVRCAYVGDRSVLSGFTLTKGSAECGGGVWCEYFGVVTNCVLTGNQAGIGGGGAFGGTLYDCTLTGNSAPGGWVEGGGGGACGSSLYDCKLTGNSAGHTGGGAAGATLYNCVLTGNSAGHKSGGAFGGTLYNCTLTGNSAGQEGGGVSDGTLYNCIVFFNRAVDGANYSGGAFAYCCTTPLPPGPGNIAADPQLATTSHLSPTSPCIGAGNLAYTTGVDIDGEPWASPPAMGADQPGPVTGPLSLWIDAGFTNVVPGYTVSFTALNAGAILKSVWDFGDGTLLTNQPFASHAWSAPGAYSVRLTGYNDSYPGGVTASVVVTVSEAVYWVNAASTNSVFPYASWETAATTIQEAIGAETVVGRLVLVTNGVYRVGTVELNGLNRVALTNMVAVRSVNGPQFTVIEGETNGVRCAYVGEGSVLSGFTLTKGTAYNGGGAFCETSGLVTNCVLATNSVTGEESSGGGASGGTLYNCTLIGNSAYRAGGASGSTLYNCALTRNSATADWGGGGGAECCTLFNCTVTGNSGGGVVGCLRVYNCIVYFNDGYNAYGGLEYCCTIPLPEGPGNIDANPRFMNAAADDFRLRPDSPCINAGNNSYAPPGPTDLDGNPRIVRGTVDIGAYEFQGPGSVISYAWLQHYGLPTDGSSDYADPDHDGMNNWQEWCCGTDPTKAHSVLRLLTPSPAGTNVTVTWQSVAGVSYFLERCTNLASLPPFSLLVTNLPGQPGTTSFTDSNTAGASLFFYRVGVGQ